MVPVVDGVGVLTTTQKKGKRDYQVVFSGAKSDTVRATRIRE